MNFMAIPQITSLFVLMSISSHQEQYTFLYKLEGSLGSSEHEIHGICRSNGLVGVIRSYISSFEHCARNICSMGDNSNFQHQVWGLGCAASPMTALFTLSCWLFIRSLIMRDCSTCSSIMWFHGVSLSLTHTHTNTQRIAQNVSCGTSMISGTSSMEGPK